MLADPMTSARQKRMGTVFGWIAGGSLGLITDFGLYVAIGQGYPLVPMTFALFVAGCFAGMWVSDRLGDRAFRMLGLAAGVLLALALTLAFAVVLTRR